jgi:ATP-dependent Lon protease
MGLNEKINEYFGGSVVRKDLVKAVKGNAIVPSYVLEYLLGQHCATDDEATIEAGIEKVKEILKKHYVHRNEAGLIRSQIREKGRYIVIDKIYVELDEKKDTHVATFSNLGINKVLIDSDTVRKNKKLLVGGVWCICTLEYQATEDSSAVPWILTKTKPIQMSSFDMDDYIENRDKFSQDEWIDTLIQSIGFNPEKFTKRNKLLQLIRLIPYCERNYNLIELGPKGTGKSHIYTEFSPHGMLISGGEITEAKLFVNNSTGRLGLVGYWDSVAFDEFAGKEKKQNKGLVDIMKGYMANKTFSRGIETLGAEASMVFVGNTKHSVAHMLKHSDLFDELPKQYHDSAFLDRLHFYIPGWEIDIIRGEMFTNGYGFVVDYIAEALKHLRGDDFSDKYKKYFELSSDIATRDRDGINKTFSGLMKILYPSGVATKDEIEEILTFAIEGRKRVKDQLMRIDSTMTDVRFEYSEISGENKKVYTLEEKEYPKYYYKRSGDDVNNTQEEMKENDIQANTIVVRDDNISELREQRITIEENQKGITYDMLFGAYIKNAKKIKITDAYIMNFFQARNVMEFVETVSKYKEEGEEIDIDISTYYADEKQLEFLEQIRDGAFEADINISWTFAEPKTIHARHIEFDTGWIIDLDNGLNIYQHYEANNAFALSNRKQEFRGCRASVINYTKA